MSLPFAQAFAGRSVLVTGHTGFKGSWLCLWLDRLGARVSGYALDPPTEPSNFVEARIADLLVADVRADLRDRDTLAAALETARPEVILHLAAQLLGQSAPELTAATRAPAIENPESKIEHGSIPWQMLAHAAPRHSILIWLSDFPPRSQPEGWSVLTRRYNTMGFRVDDPWERELPDTRALTAYDPVAGRLINLNGASAAQRSAHAAWVQSRDDAFRTLFPDQLSRLTVRTDEDRLDALVRFFHARMARGNRR